MCSLTRAEKSTANCRRWPCLCCSYQLTHSVTTGRAQLQPGVFKYMARTGLWYRPLGRFLALQYITQTSAKHQPLHSTPATPHTTLHTVEISKARTRTRTRTRTHTHPFNGPFSGTTQVSRYQKGKTNLDFTAARDSEWQWHQLGHMQVCTSLQTDNHASTPPLSFLQTGCPSCRLPFLPEQQQ